MNTKILLLKNITNLVDKAINQGILHEDNLIVFGKRLAAHYKTSYFDLCDILQNTFYDLKYEVR